MAVRQKMTVEQYLALPEEKPYLEYICGEVVPKAVPDRRHSDLAHEIDFRLGLYWRAHGGRSGPEGRVQFESGAGAQFRLPDVSYWAPGRSRQGERAMLPPTLAVEIRSPGQEMESLQERCRYFREHGVDVCWLVDPDTRTVEVFEHERDGEPLATGALESARLPGFSLDVEELFAALDS